MPSAYPLTPFRVPDATPVCDRVALLTRLSAEGVGYAAVARLADAARARVGALYAALAAAAPDVAARPDTVPRLYALEALRVVQSLPYVPGPAGQEWCQSADYTARHGGECKALSVLYAAVARRLGLRVEPVWITQTGRDLNHVAARVRAGGVGRPWLWADASMRGAMLGESPYEAAARLDAGRVVGAPAGPALRPSRVWPAPASAGPGGLPFAWSGWEALWKGWPAGWWRRYYPHLYAPPAALAADPRAYGLDAGAAAPAALAALPLGATA